MKRQLLVALLVVLSSLVYGQIGSKAPCKVYLKDGTVKEGKSSIDRGSSRIKIAGVGIGFKGKKFMQEITLKSQDGKKEKIGIDQIDRIEYERKLNKETKTIVYRPIKINEEKILARELISGKLYGAYQVSKVTLGEADGQNEFYYIKKGDAYEKTTLGSLKKEYNCSMEEGKGKEDKIIRCLQGK
ncbi:hypothetical protein [Apibacter sp. HY039]|uniref:hypothetical protein n=1 Tax=Apibacter sp. HY039 TaxID=2501476 RepID=UPI000FEC144C|nr:hypothetical protein [Apibacter sp. HY039]